MRSENCNELTLNKMFERLESFKLDKSQITGVLLIPHSWFIFDSDIRLTYESVKNAC